MDHIECNGWTNWATWNVPLWIDNEEGLYRNKLSLLAQASKPIEAGDVRFFVNAFMHNTTPDFKPGDINDVNWDEIADHWEEERLEELT